MKSALFSALVAAGLFAGGSANASLMYTLDNNIGSEPIAIDVTITELSGDLVFSLIVDSTTTGNIGDLRGFFFNIDNFDIANNYQATGAQITDIAFNTRNLGQGANVNPAGPFNIGVEIGGPGIGRGDDFQAISFVLSADASLSKSLLFGQQTAGRVTSVGPAGSGRSGSSKVLGTVPDGDMPVVPLPAAAWLLVGGIGSLGALRLRRRA